MSMFKARPLQRKERKPKKILAETVRAPIDGTVQVSLRGQLIEQQRRDFVEDERQERKRIYLENKRLQQKQDEAGVFHGDS